MATKSKQHLISDIIIFSTLFLGFYFLWLGSYPLFTPDEARYSGAAQAMLATGDFVTPHVNGIPFLDKPILYYWLQALSIFLFGINEWAVRFFPVMIALTGCLTLYVCARTLFNRTTALLSATILATTPLFYGGAHYANLDLEVAVWISCTLLCIITALQTESQRSRYITAAYVFAGLATLTKGLIGLVFPIAITGIWFLLTAKWRLLPKLHIVAGMIIIAAITIPWFTLAQFDNPNFLHYFFVTQHFSRFLSHGEFNNKSVFWFYAPVVLLGFFPWLLFLPATIVKTTRHIWHHKQAHTTELFLVIWAVFIFLFFSLPQSKLVGYIIPVMPALAILTGHYLTTLMTSHAKHRHYVYSVLLALLSFAMGITLSLVPRFVTSDFLEHANPLLTTLTAILMVAGVLILATAKHNNIKKLAGCCAILSIAVLLTVVFNASKLNPDSSKTLAATLGARIKPTDVILDYYAFHQDIPLYLSRQVKLVANWQSPDIPKRDNWMREMWLGRDKPNASNILLDEAKFWQAWSGHQRLYVFVNKNYLGQFTRHTKRYYLIDKHNDIHLFSNMPLQLSQL